MIYYSHHVKRSSLKSIVILLLTESCFCMAHILFENDLNDHSCHGGDNVNSENPVTLVTAAELPIGKAGLFTGPENPDALNVSCLLSCHFVVLQCTFTFLENKIRSFTVQSYKQVDIFKKHHHINFFVRPLHSKPGMVSYC